MSESTKQFQALPPWLQPLAQQAADGIAAGRLGHAPLIHGPAGVGKRLLADWLVARLLCTSPGQTAPCADCHSCRLLAAGTHPDHFHVSIDEDHTVIRVDSVRNLIAGLVLTPAVSPARVGRIDPAEGMNESAANALLKTLEEPADQVWLVLVTNRPGSLPATIRSRCQPLPVRVPDPDTGARWLASRVPDATAAERARALELAAGAPLTARDWLAGGEVDRGLRIRKDLLAMLDSGRQGLPDLDPWLAAPESTWQWLAHWTATFMRQRLGGDETGAAATPTLAMDPAGLERCWLDALQGRRLAATPVRQDLLFRRWLLQWREKAITQ